MNNTIRVSCVNMSFDRFILIGYALLTKASFSFPMKHTNFYFFSCYLCYFRNTEYTDYRLNMYYVLTRKK